MRGQWGVWGAPKSSIPLSKDDPCNRARWMDETMYTLHTGRFVDGEANAREYAEMLRHTDAVEFWTFEARRRDDDAKGGDRG